MEAASRLRSNPLPADTSDMAVRGDTTSLQQNAIPSVRIEFCRDRGRTIKENHANLAGAQPTPRPWALQAPGTEKIERAEFLCGVFGAHGQTTNSAVFVIPNLPPGNYAVATFDVASGKNALNIVVRTAANRKRLEGRRFLLKSFADRLPRWKLVCRAGARIQSQRAQSKCVAVLHAGARSASPVPFMSTAATDKLYDEMQAVQPIDLPVGGNTVDVAVGAKACKLINTYPVAFNDEINLVVKYQAGDVSNTAQTYQDNIALIKAIVAKYPEFREAFAGIVARAVEPSGKDYGSLMAMKEIK